MEVTQLKEHLGQSDSKSDGKKRTERTLCVIRCLIMFNNHNR